MMLSLRELNLIGMLGDDRVNVRYPVNFITGCKESSLRY